MIIINVSKHWKKWKSQFNGFEGEKRYQKILCNKNQNYFSMINIRISQEKEKYTGDEAVEEFVKLHNEINDIDQLYGGDIVEEPGIFILFSLNLYTLFQHFISIMCQYHNLCQYL